MDKTENQEEGQQPNIQVEGDVEGNLSVDRHDTTINQSVADVKAKRDAFIATSGGTITQFKKIFVEVIPSWVWIVILVVLVGSAGGVGISRYVERERLEEELKSKFKAEKKIGILIANFAPVTNKKKEIARGGDFAFSLYNELNTSLKQEEEKVVIERLYPEIAQYLKTSSQAEEFGKRLGAKLVIWGDVSMPIEGESMPGKGIERISFRVQPIRERYELQEITPNALNNMTEFQTSPEDLTKDQDFQKLVSFIVGYVYYMRAKIPGDQDWTKAIQHFEEILTIPETSKSKDIDAYTHFYLGNAYYYSNDEEKARTEYIKVIDLKNDLMEAQNNLGVLALRHYDLEGAANFFQNADEFGKCSQPSNKPQDQELNPGCVHLLYNLVCVALEQGDYAKATDYAEKAVKTLNYFQKGLTTGFWKLLDRIGIHRKSLQRFEEDFSTGFVVQLYNDTAYSYIGQGHYEKAKEYLTAVRQILEQESSHFSTKELHSTQGALNRNWGRIELGLKHWDQALEYFNAAEQDDPQEPRTHLLRAQLYDARCQPGDRDRYFSELEGYLQKTPKTPREEFSKAVMKLNTLQETYKQ